MTVYVRDADLELHLGDVRDVLPTLPAESVDCVITSPPYWGLRDYGTGAWEGGDPDCDHAPEQRGGRFATAVSAKQASNTGSGTISDRDCKCGARRVDSQLGLEATPDEYVANMVTVFREIRRVLRPHGTVWLNLGDSYASGGGLGAQGATGQMATRSSIVKARPGNPDKNGGNSNRDGVPCPPGLKPKDLVGIPWRVAFALQQPYYAGRIAAERDRVWLAAIFDGEGTICGMRHVRDNGNVRTGCMTFITNTSEALLDECDRIWPGSRYSEKVTSEVSRACWRWELQSAEDRSALVRELYPYLIEKKRQAMVAWNLLEIVQSAKKLGRGGESDETKAKRDLLVRVLSDLNQRRPVDIPSWVREPPSLLEPGWYLRSDIIWAKNNPMPESVTDRPTKAHEYVFLLSKQPRYWFDQEAVRETSITLDPRRPYTSNGAKALDGRAEWRSGERRDGDDFSGRNVRSVWEISTQPFEGAHFATFPQELVRRCLLAGCPEWVCGTCGKARTRIVESRSLDRNELPREHPEWRPSRYDNGKAGDPQSPGPGQRFSDVTTLGWSDCGHGNYQPGTVLDPFFGAGTTGLVARKHGRRTVGVELNEEYARMAAERLSQLSLLAEIG